MMMLIQITVEDLIHQ